MTTLVPGAPPPHEDRSLAGRAGATPKDEAGSGLVLVDDRMTGAREWLEEFYPEPVGDGAIRLALLDAGGEWSELLPFRADRPPFAGMVPDHAGMLDALALSVVTNADGGLEVFACPYLHAGRNRRKGGAALRRHVHADIDGPLNLDRVRFVGGLAVGSGGTTPSGPHGHVYVRLSESVNVGAHEALCRALGQFVGGEHYDPSKATDDNVLRPVGTLNHKPEYGPEPRPVEWLIRPDAEGVRTWAPGELARLLGLTWPVVAPMHDVEPVRETAPGSVQRRIEGVLRSVREAPKHEGNNRLNNCAGLAAAICATEVNAPPEAAVRAALVEAYLTRPVPAGESLASRRREALRTVASGWKWGTEHAAEALAEHAHEMTEDRDVTYADDDPGDYQRRVEREFFTLKAREEARGLLRAEKAAEEAASLPPFDLGTLAEVLARPAEPQHRVEGLILADALTLVVAQRKTGKTTLTLNLARALLTGEDFLGTFAVVALAAGERVALLNYEVSAGLAAQWASRIGVPPDGLVLVNLRGRRNPLAHDADRDALGQRLRALGVATVIGDPFSRMFTGDNANDAGQVTAFLSLFDTWARSVVGARDVVLTTHAGWDAERARNSSALEDAPDSIITLTTGRSSGDADGRYLRAVGRGVDVDEDRLTFDPVTLRLAMSGRGSRRSTGDALAVERLVPEVVEYVTEHPGASGRAVTDAVDGRADVIRKALRLAEERNLIRTEQGKRNRVDHYPVAPSDSPEPPVRPSASERVPDAVSERVRASYMDADAHTHTPGAAEMPDADALDSHHQQEDR